MMMEAVHPCGYGGYSCLSSITGLDAINDWDWSNFLHSLQSKHVQFQHPVVTSCHYRPRETQEECIQLYFTEREMMVMRAQARESDEIERFNNDSFIMTRSKTPQPFTPKFETIAQTGSEVKVMYAVPKSEQRCSSSARLI